METKKEVLERLLSDVEKFEKNMQLPDVKMSSWGGGSNAGVHAMAYLIKSALEAEIRLANLG